MKTAPLTKRLGVFISETVVRTAVIALPLSGLAGACTSPASSPALAFTVRDSAGIIIADNRGATSVLPESAVMDSREQALDLGELFGIRVVFPLSETALLVSGSSNGAPLEVNHETGESHSLGGVGDGPGEFGGVQAIGRCANDTVMVGSYPARLTTLDPARAFVRMAERPPLRNPILGFADDCSAVVITIVERSPTWSGRTVTLPLNLFWYMPEVGSSALIVSVRGAESGLAELYRRPAPVPLPYGSLPSFASQGDLVYVALGNLPEVRVFDRHQGLVRIIRWEAEPDPVDDAARADYDRIRLSLDDRSGRGGVSAEFPAASKFDLPPDKPLYSRLLVTDDGHLWVQRYPDVWVAFEQAFMVGFSDQKYTWWVFSPEGQLLGLYSTPRSLLIHAISRGTVFGVRRDSDDLDHVVMVPLVAAAQGRSGNNLPSR